MMTWCPDDFSCCSRISITGLPFLSLLVVLLLRRKTYGYLLFISKRNSLQILLLFWFRMKGKKEKHIACWWLCIQCWMKLEKRRRKATDKERHVSHEGRKTRSISSTFLFFLHLWCSVWFMPLPRISFCFKTSDCRLWDINGDETTTRIGWLQYPSANEHPACKPRRDKPCKRFLSVNSMKNRSFDWITDEFSCCFSKSRSCVKNCCYGKNIFLLFLEIKIQIWKAVKTWCKHYLCLPRHISLACDNIWLTSCIYSKSLILTKLLADTATSFRSVMRLQTWGKTFCSETNQKSEQTNMTSKCFGTVIWGQKMEWNLAVHMLLCLYTMSIPG